MSYSLPVNLLYIMCLQIRIVGLYIIPDLIAKITYYKNKFMYTVFPHLINNDTQHGFACKRNKSLWLCIAMWAQLSACTCYWYDCLHINPPAGGTFNKH